MRPTDHLDAAAQAHPDRACLVTDERSWTYAEVRTLAWRIATRVRAAGFVPGDHGAVLSPNDPVSFICTLGLMKAGLVWLPTNPRNGVPENAELLERLECDVLFVHSSLAGIASAVGPRVREIVVFDQDLEDWLGDTPADDVQVDAADDDLAAIAATSGTTGEPKGVMLSHRNFAAFTEGVMKLRGDWGRPVYLAAAPLTHVAGRTCFPMIALGATIVVLPKVDPKAVLRAIERHHVTELFLPPTAVYALLDEPSLAETDLSSLRNLSSGSAPIRLDRLKQALEVFGPVVSQGYGQTEAPMLISSLRPEEHFVDGRIAPDERLSSCGRPTPFVSVAILDQSGRELPAGETGEICVRGGIVMQGYYRNPAATDEVSRHGWHHTGDIGYLDAEGYLHIVDRVKDMIISGGFNVYSAQVEQVLTRHPAVAEAVVLGVPDEKWGEAVKAIVRLRAEASDEELIAYCKEKLGSVKAPKTVERWDEIPKGPTGKVLKGEIRQRYWTGSGRKV